MNAAYTALHESVAVIDLSARGRIRVTGEDRARLLHAMSTNHVQGLQPGQGVYAFFLDAQGRIQADANIFCFSDHFLLDVEPERRMFVLEHLDRFIIADDVTLEDTTDDTWCVSIEGVLSEPPVDLPGPYSHAESLIGTVASVSFTGAPGFRVFGSGDRPMFDAVPADAETANTVRLEHYKPRFGVDITDKTIPQESQQMRAVHFQKGCYIGQEIVERVRARGHVNRLLMGFHLDTAVPIATGEKVFADDKDVGEVTSAATSENQTFGLAIVRVPTAAAGASVKIANRPATLHNPS